jgi:hypothetical protein
MSLDFEDGTEEEPKQFHHFNSDGYLWIQSHVDERTFTTMLQRTGTLLYKWGFLQTLRDFMSCHWLSKANIFWFQTGLYV